MTEKKQEQIEKEIKGMPINTAINAAIEKYPRVATIADVLENIKKFNGERYIVGVSFSRSCVIEVAPFQTENFEGAAYNGYNQWSNHEDGGGSNYILGIVFFKKGQSQLGKIEEAEYMFYPRSNDYTMCGMNFLSAKVLPDDCLELRLESEKKEGSTGKLFNATCSVDLNTTKKLILEESSEDEK